MARPKKLRADEATLGKVEALSRVLATQEDMAAMLGVTVKTFTKFVAENAEAQAAIERGNAAGRVSLRSRLFSSKSPHAMLFLARAVLKMDDKPTVNLNVTTTNRDPRSLTDEELDDLILAELKRLTPTSADDPAD